MPGAPPLATRWSCEQNLGRSTLRDGEHRCRLGSVTFGIMQVAPETDVQNRRIGRRVRNCPEQRCTRRGEECAPRERPAAIHRQPKLALTPRQRDVRKLVVPLDHDPLPRVENLSRYWRSQLESVMALGIQLRRKANASATMIKTNPRIFIFDFSVSSENSHANRKCVKRFIVTFVICPATE